MPNPREIDLVAMLNPCLGLEMVVDPRLVLTIMSNPRIGLATMPDYCLGLSPNKAINLRPSLAPNMVVKLKILGYGMIPISKWLKPVMFARPKQTINKHMTVMHSSCQEREKKEKKQIIDHRRQSNHDMSTSVVPCGRGHIYASI